MIPWRRDEGPPPYLVAGGLVFRELDGRYLLTWGNDWRTKASSQLRYFYDLLRQAQTPNRRSLGSKALRAKR